MSITYIFQSKLEIFMKSKQSEFYGHYYLWQWAWKKHPIYVSKNKCEENHVELLLIEEEGNHIFDNIVLLFTNF